MDRRRAKLALRLAGWRKYEHSRAWIGDIARKVIPELEADLRAQTQSGGKDE
jgi:hypothetical protein